MQIQCTCLRCGQPFFRPKGHENRARYCSRPCQFASQVAEPTELACQGCGVTFVVRHPCVARKRMLCSRHCSKVLLLKSVEKTCEACGRAFTARACKAETARFCSRHCRDTMNRTLEERFWLRVIKTETCWLWEPTAASGKYGAVGIKGLPGRSNRAAWYLTFGEIPEGMHVLHRCDNPPCVRPDHLFLGTNLDNHYDKMAKGRQARGASVSGENCPSSKLSTSQVLEIRRQHEARETSIRELSRRYSVSRPTIKAIVRRETWRHLA